MVTWKNSLNENGYKATVSNSQFGYLVQFYVGRQIVGAYLVGGNQSAARERVENWVYSHTVPEKASMNGLHEDKYTIN